MSPAQDTSAQDTSVRYAALPNRLIVIGYGSIAQAVLPMILRHLDIEAGHIRILCPRTSDTSVANEYGFDVAFEALTEENHETVLERHVQPGDFVLNLSVNVGSVALIRYCWRRGALYLDTSIEPWHGRSNDPQVSLSQRSNYALREEVLAFRLDKRDGPTAVITQGANPGLASAMVKQALINMAHDTGTDPGEPSCYEDWATLARTLGIRVIHIAEQDTQVGAHSRAAGEFVSTWSADGFIEEGLQAAELGWGSHERHWPAEARRHGFGCDAAIYLARPGFATRVRSWTPLGPYHGYLITHGESISIADHLSLREHGEVVYRPTVHYAYRPCPDSLLSIDELAGRGWRPQEQKRLLRDDIVQGADELGVLLMGNERGVYWYGSRLTNDQARRLMPHNSATSLQVSAGIVAGMVCALQQPRAGVVEPDDLDYRTLMRVARPYLGEVLGVYDAWTPLAQHSPLYDTPNDPTDPWQFVNFYVT